jgi:hypothetical protein
MAHADAQAARKHLRWQVKTLTDPAAKDIDPSPLWTYVRSLVALPAPDPPPSRDQPRIQPWEFRTFIVPVRMMLARSKGDGDIHLVVADLDDEELTMVVELPSARVGARRKSIACTRRFLVCRFGEPPFSPAWLKLKGKRANIYGVGFFDRPHAAHGARNGIELHPVVALSLATHPGDAERPDELAALIGRAEASDRA